MTQQEVKEALRLQIATEGIGACEKLLETSGVLERLEAAENTAAVRLNSDLPTLVDLLPRQAKVKRQVLRAVEQLVGSQRRAVVLFSTAGVAARLPDFDSGDLSRHLRELSDAVGVRLRASVSRPGHPPARAGPPLRGLGNRFRRAWSGARRPNTRSSNTCCGSPAIIAAASRRSCSYFGETDPASRATTATIASRPRRGGRHGDARSSRRPRCSMPCGWCSAAWPGYRSSRTGCGKQLLAQMLCGSNAKPVTRNRLDKLSTFGLLSHLKQPEVVQLIDALLIRGLLEQTEIEPFRPVLRLTDAGADVMSGADAEPSAGVVARRIVAQARPGCPAAANPGSRLGGA